MGKPKFSVVWIMRNEASVLPRLLKSIEEFRSRGGETIALDTGSTDNSVSICREWGAKVTEVGTKYLYTIDKDLADKINDRFVVDDENPIVKEGDKYFSFFEARNHCSSLASNDFVCTVDCDEELTKFDIDAINKIIEDPNLAHLEYDFIFSHDQFGRPAINFTQSKFFDRTKMQWSGIVHEVLTPINGGTRKFLTPDIFRLEHWQQPGDRHSYLKGLAVDCFNNSDSDRNSHYFAREMMFNDRPKSALKEFTRHVKMNKWVQERSKSMVFVGKCYGMIGEPVKQAAAYSQAFYIDSSRREPLIELAQFYFHNKNYQAAISYTKAAMEIPWTPFYANDRSHYENLPHEILYKSYGWAGNIKEAQEHILKALEYQPYNPEYLRDTKYYFEYGAPEIDGWMSFPELRWLYNTSKKCESIAEVGSWKGRSTHALLSGGAKITAIDTWQGSDFEKDDTNRLAKLEDVFEVFKNNVKGFDNLTIDRNRSLDSAKNYPDKTFDCVFIDAGHRKEDILEDIKAWLPKTKKIICGHDYKPDVWMGVVEGVNEVFGKPDGVEDTIWWVDLEKRSNKKESIPKRIFTAWIGDEPPEMIKKCIESQKIPGYEHFVIGIREAEEVAKNDHYVRQALDAKKWVKAVDYLKAYYLNKEGGIFLDADMEVLPGKNFDDLLDNSMFACREENGFLGYSVVGSVSGHQIWEQYLKEVSTNFRGDDDKNFESSMEIFTKLGYAGKSVKILEPEYFFPYNHQTGLINVTQNTRAFHHFTKSWTNLSDLLPKVSIILPTLGRPEGLKRCLDSIDRLYYPKHLIETVVIDGEGTVPEKMAKGLSQSKGDIVVYAANDIEFNPESLYRAVKMTDKYGLVSFNTGADLLPDEGYLCEHFIIRKDFIPKIGGEIFDTEFHHVGVDQLLWAKAKKLEQAALCKDAIVNHYHFSRGTVEKDEVYNKGWSKAEQDRELLNKKLGELGIEIG